MYRCYSRYLGGTNVCIYVLVWAYVMYRGYVLGTGGCVVRALVWVGVAREKITVWRVVWRRVPPTPR